MIKWHVQFSRYALVGLLSNAVGYLLYLLLTEVNIGHKTAMTLVYCVGVLQTFIFNRSWSFRHQGQAWIAFKRYVLSYSAGYLFNLVMLILLVDEWGWPHQWVQGGIILVLAGILFILQRYWVFRNPKMISI